MVDPAATSLSLALGVSALVTVACRRVSLPALLPLLLTGLALGNSGLGLVDANALEPALKGFITVAIGLLIFEGTLHLNREELSHAPRAVYGLLSIGALLTWAGSALAAHFLLGMSWSVSLILGATLIVTGPTVVQPILRLIRVTPPLRTALGAEAVLIDPLGVVATVTTLEIVRLAALSGTSGLAGLGLWLFLKPLLGGAGLGLLMGALGTFLLRLLSKSQRPEPQLLNLIAVGVCMTCVGVGEAITAEAGLAAVTLCGVIMARTRVLGGTELRAFKELLAVMLVGTLFVLLTSRFDVARLRTLTWGEAAFLAALLFIVRPISIILSTWGSTLTLPERIFAATFAPRGIVALSVAAVAAAELRTLAQSDGVNTAMLQGADRLELVMFVVIAGTVLAASALSPLLAWVLNVRAGQGRSVLLVGAHPLGAGLATALREHGLRVRLLDSNATRVASTVASGLDALAGDATDARWLDDVGAHADTGTVLAWTGNHDVDRLVARWASERHDPTSLAVWSSKPVNALPQQDLVDLGASHPLAACLDDLARNQLALSQSPAPEPFTVPTARLLGVVHAGRFLLPRPDGTPPILPKSTDKQGTLPPPVYIGLLPTA